VGLGLGSHHVKPRPAVGSVGVGHQVVEGRERLAGLRRLEEVVAAVVGSEGHEHEVGPERADLAEQRDATIPVEEAIRIRTGERGDTAI
jgi:hypothetical protein